MNNLTPQKSDILLLSAPKKAKNISILAPFPARFFSLIIIFILTSIFSISHMLPDVRNLDNHFAPQSTEILDRNGNVLYVVHGDENRKKITFNEISPYLVNATLAIEDDRFYSHHGFDIYGTGQAALHEIFGVGEKRGGSTITQQYIKNTFLTPEKTYSRKFKEILLAMKLELVYNKNKILNLYLNRIPYGNNAYGCQKAAEIYFNKNAKDLNLTESVILASLPQAPSKYNPYGSNRYSNLNKNFTLPEIFLRKIDNFDDLKQNEYTLGLIGKNFTLENNQTLYIPGRTDLVLNRMLELNQITKEEKNNALQNLQNFQFEPYTEPIKYPHFVFYIRELLEEKYGKETLEQGGLKVYTTLDPDLQNYAEKIATERGQINLRYYYADNLAILTVNAKTGEILAMVGSRDYFNEEIDGNVNVVTRPRQPGSSFKPIVYAKAFENGYNPGNIIYDVPTKIGNNTPQNYDGKYFGLLTIRKALGQSRNIPAIKAYYLAGEQNEIIALAKKMGINSLDPKHSYGYPLALGAGEVSLLEMVQAYSVFANNGKKIPVTGILKIEDANGNILEEIKSPTEKTVLDPQIAYLITSILSDKTIAVGQRLFVKNHINAAKTGTSTKETKNKWGYKTVRPGDNWTIGYTPTIVTGVWVGNTDGEGLSYYANGYVTATPVFNAIMTEALKNHPNEPFPVPEGITEVQISKYTGLLPSYYTKKNHIITEIFADFAIPTEKDASYKRYRPIADFLNWANEIKAYYKNKKL